MKAYKWCYNEETKKLDYVEFFVKNKYDFSNDPVTNLTDADNGHTVCEMSFFSSLDAGNKKLESGIWKVFKCKDCGRYFIIDSDEEQWFQDRDLSLPKRCVKCRAKRRKDRNSES